MRKLRASLLHPSVGFPGSGDPVLARFLSRSLPILATRASYLLAPRAPCTGGRMKTTRILLGIAALLLLVPAAAAQAGTRHCLVKPPHNAPATRLFPGYWRPTKRPTPAPPTRGP